MEKERIYSFKVSGIVHPDKKSEFQQTVIFVFDHLPQSCISWNLALDVFHADLFHIYSLWTSRKSLLSFRSGNEFQLLKSAFDDLGTYRESVGGIKDKMYTFGDSSERSVGPTRYRSG